MIRQTESALMGEQETRTILFYLTALAHIDGELDVRERDFIRGFIRRHVTERVEKAMPDLDPEQRAEVSGRWTLHFQSIFAGIEHTVQSYFSESVDSDSDPREFVAAKLKLRCLELFRRFAPDSQARLLILANELILADGIVHPNEARFRADLEQMLAEGAGGDADATQAIEYPIDAALQVSIDPPQRLTPRIDDHEFLRSFEYTFERDKGRFARQVEWDLKLAEKALSKLNAKRDAGAGELRGARTVADLAGKQPFLDGYVYGLAPQPGKDYELLVLGDLHGCYSCMKAALLQADFFGKADAHINDPVNNPAMKLVLLGDYIDRGRFGFDGILRAALKLFTAAPDHVYLLRGNHEYFIEYNGNVISGVRPAESLNGLMDIADPTVFSAWRQLFEQLPTSMLFGQTLFVHGGIPRDDTMHDTWKDLSSLNDPEIRFQMLWSDPSEVEHVPHKLQAANARFPFGRQQFRTFMQRIGCTTMVRGHEREVEGIKVVYDDLDARLVTLFSAGGANNDDLPDDSNYREVTPMAMRVFHRDGVTRFAPFVIDYERFNRPERNAFFRTL